MNGYVVALATLLYVIAAGLIVRRITHKQNIQTLDTVLVACSLLAHGWVVLASITGSDGQDMSMTNVLTLIAWLTTLTMLLSMRWMPNTLLMPGVVIFSALSVIAVALIPDNYIVKVALSSGMISHITLSLLAYACLSIAFLYAVQMTLIRNRLKHKNKSLINPSLPPLMLVESLLFRLTLLGSALLAIALLSGFIFVESMFAKQYAHKTVLSLLALAVYVLLLLGQHIWGWRNKQVVMLTSLGLSLLSLSYFGSRFVREVLL